MSNNKEDFDAQVSAFKEKYPDFKPAKPIEVLNLIMTRKNAKEILEGKKKLSTEPIPTIILVVYLTRMFWSSLRSMVKKRMLSKRRRRVLLTHCE